MQIIVRDNNVDQALRALKKKLQREGVYREMKLRRHYEKPSEKRAQGLVDIVVADDDLHKPNDLQITARAAADPVRTVMNGAP